MRVNLLGLAILILALCLFSTPVATADDFDPWCYDFDEDGKVEKHEALRAVADYFNFVITKANALKALALYYQDNPQ